MYPDMDVVQPLLIGLVGSLHCIGMCGPIALAVPLSEKNAASRVISGLLYNLGRIVTYGLLGVVFGLLGMGFILWGFQRWVSLAVGVIMILSVLYPHLFSRFLFHDRLSRWFSPLKRGFGKLFGLRTYGSVLAIGILNGFLPCGLVYIALAGALLTSGPAGGAGYMILFGLGTIPALLAVSLLGNAFASRFRGFTGRIIPAVILLIGILFILRGLNLGIPYVSPKMEKPESHRQTADSLRAVPSCCQH